MFIHPLISRSASIACGFAVSIAAVVGAAEPAKVSFNRDIRPIMSDTCFHCHGFDPKTREAGLRLDLREEAIIKTEDGTLPIVPGKPELSEIITRIMDDDDPMPPEKAHKPFTPEQKELFRRWVAEGAEYEPHWAYAPLQRPALPVGFESKPAIDAFVQAKLAEKKIEPSAEAPKAKLLRRLSLDLTGLPPTPAEVAAYVQDESKDAYTQQVRRLLASPHFGERMAVWWLDIARFADTVGYHGDQNQRVFPYRDYVINAFNTNKRFDQFTLEQLAGDLLPNPTNEQLVATGYNRLNMMTREGGVQAPEFLAKYGAERVRSVAAAWFGSTFGCAECHDHKFDPIKTRDFYELQSFFADVKQYGVYADYKYTPVPELEGFNNDSPFPPEVETLSPYLKKRADIANAELGTHLKAWETRVKQDAKLRGAFAKWQQEMRGFLAANADGWESAKPDVGIHAKGKRLPKREPVIGADGSVQVDKALAKGESLEWSLTSKVPVAAVRLEILTQGLDAAALKGEVNVTLEVLGADEKRTPVAFHFGDATAHEPSYKDGDTVQGVMAGWKLPKQHDKLSAVWLLEEPKRLAAGEKFVVSLVGPPTLPVRLSVSPLGGINPLVERNEAALTAVTWLTSTRADAEARSVARSLAKQVRELNGGRTWSLVTKATQPLKVRVLPRGNWQDETGPVVLPSTPSFLPARIESTDEMRLTRLDLAKWITSKENPITARAVMNRLWQPFFGIGLSAAVDDLGSQGELPSHPELLDWLASEFRESGWDVKHMIELMVTSQTYRQSSSLRPELKESDPANRLLASQNPRRLEAEFVRDNALFIAGKLNLADIGGPSAKPYQPPGYYEAIQFPSRDYIASTDEEQWRRGVYMHWQRTFMHPMLANFDAPARDECAALRTVSNTPQQALTLLNDPTFVEAARLFAGRLIAKAKTDEQRLSLAFEIALAREPKAKEASALLVFLNKQREQFKSTPEDAKKLLQVGIATQDIEDPVEVSAWTQVCRVLLNAQETITRY